MEARHLGRSAGLVDEDELFGVELGLQGAPGVTRLGDVGSILLGRVRGFF
jgi:hypothetical protein